MVEKTGVEAENIKDRVPSIRFSDEIYLMVRTLTAAMKECPAFKKNDEYICSQVLGLTFVNQLHKIMENVEVFLYPYVAKIRMLPYTALQMKDVHSQNIKNAFSTLGCVLTGQRAFPESRNDGAAKAALQALDVALFQGPDFFLLKQELLKKVLGYGRDVAEIRSYKNFELQILHNLDQEDTHLVISKKFVGELLVLLLASVDGK